VLVDLDSDPEPDYHIDRRIYDDAGFQQEYVFDHALEHYRDTVLGVYRLLVFGRIGSTLGQAVGEQWDGSSQLGDNSGQGSSMASSR